MAFDKFSRTSMVGFARLIRRIRSRTSFRTDGRPGWPCRTFHVQKRRKPFRCQAITVFGLDHDERGAPVSPHSAQPSPEEPVEWGQLRLLHGAMQNAQLVPERKVFELESSSGFED